MASTVPITGSVAGVACLAAAAGAKSWLRAHRRGQTAAGPTVDDARHLDPGHAVSLFDGATGFMVTVTGGGAGGPPPAVELRRVPAVDDDDSCASLELPAFPAEALFVVVPGRGTSGGVGLRSVGCVLEGA